MKTAKIALPLSVLALIGIILAMILFDKMSTAPDDERLSYGLSYAFLLIINIIPMILFIPVGIGIIVCEICLFAARNKLATLTAALVLMCVLLPTVLFASIMSLSALAQFSAAFAVIVALSMACYITALVMVFISYFKVRAKLKKERLQN